MVEARREGQLVEWLRRRLPELSAAPADGEAPEGVRLSALRRAGGVDHTDAEAMSVALQGEFASVEAADRWADGVLAPVAQRFSRAFAPSGMAFTSVFETIDPE